MNGDASALPDGADGVRCIKPGVRALDAYSLDPDVASRKLDQNESPFDLPDHLKADLAAQFVSEAWNRYPAFVPRSLSARLADRHRWTPDGVLVGNGSNELIQAAFQTLVSPGDIVVTPSPTFSLYALLIGVAGGRHRPVPLEREWKYDEGAFLVAAKTAKVVVLCSPNNPTGSVCSHRLVEQIVAETDAFVIVDEAYQEFGGASMVPLLRLSSRLIVLRTFSKALGLAGLRCGYALAHPEVTAEVAKAKLPYNVNRFTLAAAGIALANLATMTSRVTEIVERRDRTATVLAEIPGVHVFPSQANFLLLRFETVSAQHVFQRLLQDFDILVRDVSGAPELTNCLRITIGTEDDMRATCQAIRTVVT